MSKPIRPIIDNGDGTSTVVLTQGQVALIDTADAPLIDGVNWCALWSGLTRSFYAVTSARVGGKQTTQRMHRVIMGVTNPSVRVDHIHHITLDNRRSQLRTANASQNLCNQRARTGTSGYKGVCWDSRELRWRASARLGGIYKHKYFTTELEAALAYDSWARELHGEFAYLNFPGEVSNDPA